MVKEHYQIHVTISGKLLDFSEIKSDYNKYSIGLGHLEFTVGKKTYTIAIIANKELHDWLIDNIGENVEIRGSIRNFRRDETRFNVLKIFEVEKQEEPRAINDVTAVCMCLGYKVNKQVNTKCKSFSTALSLITNEKYNKHVRLSGIFFNYADQPPKFNLPTMESVNKYRGYLQASPSEIPGAENNIELHITSIEEIKE